MKFLGTDIVVQVCKSIVDFNTIIEIYIGVKYFHLHFKRTSTIINLEKRNRGCTFFKYNLFLIFVKIQKKKIKPNESFQQKKNGILAIVKSLISQITHINETPIQHIMRIRFCAARYGTAIKIKLNISLKKKEEMN